MHRPTIAEIARAVGLAQYLAMRHPPLYPQEIDCFDYTNSGTDYDHAAGYQYVNAFGIQTTTTVYNPAPEDQTLSQLWIYGGTCSKGPRDPQSPCTPSNAVQSVELGWINVPGQVGPELFVFITQDGYTNYSCYAGSSGNCCGNTSCFVAMPGAQFTPFQVLSWGNFGNPPNEVQLFVGNELAIGGSNTWDVFVDGSLIGQYLPGTFNGTLSSGIADYYQVGGEVYDPWPNGAHTHTQMGSGWSPGQGNDPPNTIAYHRNIQFLDTSNLFETPSLSFINGTGVCGYQASSYYGLGTALSAGGNWGTYFYFGGSDGCPPGYADCYGDGQCYTSC